jgi:hypothetical protein
MSRFNQYVDYKTAALRHLMTCEYLVECIRLPDNASHKPLSLTYREKLLKNIYYLSGYTIESIVNFAIYECINQTKPTINKIITVNQLCEPTYKLIFSMDRSKTPRHNSDRTFYQYIIAYHKFRENYKVLAIIANSNPNFDQIPVVGGKVYPSNWSNFLRNMFNSWEAQIRYKSNVNYTEDEIIEFFNLSKEIYTGIRSHITN